jgi:hypothetical protein
MAKYVHDCYQHVYYLSQGVYGTTLKQYTKDEGVPGSSIRLTDQELVQFKEMLKKGGWYEQSTSR